MKDICWYFLQAKIFNFEILLTAQQERRRCEINVASSKGRRTTEQVARSMPLRVNPQDTVQDVLAKVRVESHRFDLDLQDLKDSLRQGTF